MKGVIAKLPAQDLSTPTKSTSRALCRGLGYQRLSNALETARQALERYRFVPDPAFDVQGSAAQLEGSVPKGGVVETAPALSGQTHPSAGLPTDGRNASTGNHPPTEAGQMQGSSTDPRQAGPLGWPIDRGSM